MKQPASKVESKGGGRRPVLAVTCPKCRRPVAYVQWDEQRLVITQAEATTMTRSSRAVVEQATGKPVPRDAVTRIPVPELVGSATIHPTPCRRDGHGPLTVESARILAAVKADKQKVVATYSPNV